MLVVPALVDIVEHSCCKVLENETWNAIAFCYLTNHFCSVYTRHTPDTVTLSTSQPERQESDGAHACRSVRADISMVTYLSVITLPQALPKQLCRRRVCQGSAGSAVTWWWHLFTVIISDRDCCCINTWLDYQVLGDDRTARTAEIPFKVRKTLKETLTTQLEMEYPK